MILSWPAISAENQLFYKVWKRIKETKRYIIDDSNTLSINEIEYLAVDQRSLKRGCFNKLIAVFYVICPPLKGSYFSWKKYLLWKTLTLVVEPKLMIPLKCIFASFSPNLTTSLGFFVSLPRDLIELCLCLEPGLFDLMLSNFFIPDRLFFFYNDTFCQFFGDNGSISTY